MLILRSAAVSRSAILRISSQVCKRFSEVHTNDIKRNGTRQLSVLASHESNLIHVNKILDCQSRSYAKGKDKKGKAKQNKAHVSDEEMSEVVNVTQLRDQYANILEKLKEEYIRSLTLRTSAGGIETLPVELEGDKYPLNEIAQVSRKSAQMLVISAAAFPQATVGIVQAIRESGMNLNPQQEGTTIYVPLPKVTREHRENLAKNAKTIYNRCKDQLRDAQNNFIRKSKSKEGEVSDDLLFNTQLKIREIAEEHMQEAENLMSSKQKELLKTN